MIKHCSITLIKLQLRWAHEPSKLFYFGQRECFRPTFHPLSTMMVRKKCTELYITPTLYDYNLYTYDLLRYVIYNNNTREHL